jgi:murein DD-endopeptidase MepM/ murein hydrolase activator NlpD
MYTTDIAYFNEAIDLIYKSLLPADDLYAKYLATGVVPTYTVDGKTYTDIVIDSSISVQEGFIPAEYALDSTDDVYFYLLHGNAEKQVEEITPNNSTKSIQNQYQLSDQTMKLNNQGMDNSSLYYDGQEIVVNPLDPQIRFATYYEENVTEPIPFHTQEQQNSDMPEGDTNVLQNGVDGEKQVTYKTKVVNNQVDSTVAVKSEVTKRSEDYIVEVGTKTPEPEVEAPKSASGKLQVPSSGSVICGWYCYEGHAALDYQAWYGAPIYAADSGYVTVAGPYGGGAGNTVIIDHGNGMTTEYMHMSSVATTPGAYVTKGQVIGYEGSTGSVTTEHLHFVVKVNGVKVNPMNYY